MSSTAKGARKAHRRRPDGELREPRRRARRAAFGGGLVTFEEIAGRCARVFLGLTETEVAQVWVAVLFRRVPADERLRDRVEHIERLRDDVGRESAARNRSANVRGDAA